MAHRNILVNGLPNAYSKNPHHHKRASCQCALFFVGSTIPALHCFLQKRYRKHISPRQFTYPEEEYFPISLSNAIRTSSQLKRGYRNSDKEYLIRKEC